MAVLLRRKRVLAAKIESTPGTAESLSASDGAMNIFETDVQPEIAFTQREGQGAFSPLPGVLGAYGGRISFFTDLTGDGVGSGVPGFASKLFPACGLVVSTTTYSPTTEAPGSNVKTVTIGVYENGLLKRLRGCMGNMRIVGVNGERIRVEFEFTGLWEDPADATILAPTYPTLTPIRFVGSTFTLGGAAVPATSSFTFDTGNEITLRESGSTSGGYVTALIVGRRPTCTFDPESDVVATWDPYGDWTAATEQALSLAVGSGSGGVVTIAGSKFQITELQEADRGGKQIDRIVGQYNRNAAAGDDEFTIAFT